MSRWAALITIAAALALVPTANSQIERQLHHKPFKQMSLSELAQFQERSVAFHHRAVRFWLNQRRNHTRIFLSAVHRSARCSALGIRAPKETCFHANAWRWTTRELGETRVKIAARERAMLPAHLALWRCIAGYPGARPGGGTGESGGYQGASNGSHFNVLQMTMPWGSGSYYVADPIHASAEAVIAAAERGYVANGYSQSWLIGQWGQTISPCWGFAAR